MTVFTMNRLGSIKCTYVVFLFGFSCLHHIEGVHVEASTDFNSPQIKDSQLLKPQVLDIDVNNSHLERSTSSKNKTHGCCHNKTINETNSIARYIGESTARHQLPRIPHGPNKSEALQLESAKFITAEKLVPLRDGIITRNEVTKDDTAIVSNSNEIIPNQVQSNTSLQEKNASTLQSISNFTNPFVERNNYTVRRDNAEEFSHPPIGIIKSDVTQDSNISNKNDFQNSTLSKVRSPPHKSEVEFSSTKTHLPGEDTSLIVPNSTEYLEEINTETVDDDRKRNFWTGLPFLRDTFKYLVTDFYPDKILNSLSNGFGSSNQTKNSGGVKPSVVYPLVMEGVSILFNRFLENGSNESTEGSQGAIRGRIANIMTESIGELLRNKTVEGEIVTEKSTADGKDEDFGGLDLETVKSLLPLIQTAQSNEELSDVVSKFLRNPSGEFGDLNKLLKNYSSQLNGILSNRNVLEIIAKQRFNQSNALNLTNIGLDLETVKSLLPLIQTAQSNGELSDVVSKFLRNPSGEFGDLNNLLKNYSPQLNGILSNRNVLEVIAKQRFNQSSALNLTNIMEQFIPNNGGEGEDGMSPKNPLLRSEFVSKILSKSPVAHLGALDDSIKKLVTSSLERAVSRVKIDQNGQIHMSEGMKKMVNKMLEGSDSATTGTSAMDSINGILRAVVQSSPGPMNVTEDTPKGRRNVSHHSHLHRRFMEKYGKDPRVGNSSPSKCHRLSIVLLVVPITWALQVL